MAGMPDIGVHYLRPFHGCSLQGNQIVSVVKGGNHTGGYELKNNRIPRVFPSKDRTVKAVHHRVSKEYIGPYRPPCLIGHVESNKIRAAGGGVSL